MKTFVDVIVRLGPVFGALFLFLVVSIGIVLVAYSSWQLFKMRHGRPLAR